MTTGPRSVDEVLFGAHGLQAEERERFLESACGDDEELRAEVVSLLAELESADGFLESPPTLPPIARAEADGSAEDLRGAHLGPWVLGDRIGEGGMGAVYLGARADGAFEKEVAVKVIRPGPLRGELRRRFLNERQALAGLEHPNIARLLDGGEGDEGIPFLVMEHVAGGVPIDRACRETGRSTVERLSLFLDVCAAVEHAHARLVLHRDIKPSNVLLDREGQVKLLDFGIAKILGTDVDAEPSVGARPGNGTLAGPRAMTPAFASPEQRRGEPVTTATDVYSLGVLLHLLVTDEMPADASGRWPRGDLGHILRRALAERPEDRYPTVDRLADDLRRHGGHLPVEAAPDSVAYRAKKFYRRNRRLVIAGLAVATTLVGATVVSIRSSLEATAARRTAEVERASAEQVSAFLEGILGSIDPEVARGRDVGVLADVIDRAAERMPRALGDRPRVAARLHGTLGSAYERIARFESAEEQLRLAVERARDLGGAPLAGALTSLGVLLTNLSRDAEAETALREAVGIASGLGEEGAVEHAAALSSLGRSLEKTASATEAERAHRRALEIRRRVLGQEHPRVADSLDLLGWLLTTTDRPAEGESLIRRAVEIRRAQAEPQPLHLAANLGHLAYAVRLQGRLEEAQRLNEEALEVSRRFLGDDHPRVATHLSTLASILELRGELSAAETVYREALETQRRTLGERHREVGTTLNNLGVLRRKLGRHREAVATLEEARQTYAAALGSDHPWVTIARGNLVQTLAAAGDWPAAHDGVTAYLTEAREFWPDDHWRIAAFENTRGACLATQGEHDEARTVLADSHRRLEAGLGADHPLTRLARQRLDDLPPSGRPSTRTAEPGPD